MSKQFYVWKDRNCNGIDPEWVQLTGKEYYRFIKDPLNAGRYFVELGDESDHEAGVIFMEATLEDYKKWRSESRSHMRLHKINLEYIEHQCSLDEPAGDEEDVLLHELVADKNASVVEQVLRNSELLALRKVLNSLDSGELELINALYLRNSDMRSEREIATLLNIPQKTLNNRKKKIFEKIKKSLAQNRFLLASKEVEG